MSQARHVLEDYRLERVLTSTARTTVFRATDPATDRPVAIKLIHPAGPTIQESNRSAFLYAAEVARTGVISGLPRIIDFGLTHDDNAFLVMDMVELAVTVEGLGDAPPRRFIRVARGVANAVDTLAMSGAAHLNLRPTNVLVTADESVLLSGYGTGAWLAGAPSGAWPDPGDPWVAPELNHPDALRVVDLARADVYSLARVICALLSADVKGSGEGAPAIRLDPDLIANSAELESALAVALNPRPEERSTTVSDLGLLLGEADSQSTPAAAVGGFDPSAFETRAITSPLHFDEPPAVNVVAVDLEEPVDEGPHPGDEAEASRPAEAGGPPVVVQQDRAGKGVRWDIIMPVAALAVVALIVTVLLAGRSHRDELAVTATPVPVALPTEVPTPAEEVEPAINPLLEQAEQLMLDGDVGSAKRLLFDFPDQLVASFGSKERELYEGLLGTIEGEDRDKAVADLEGGLEYGSVRMLQRGVAGVSGLPADERASIPDLQAKLDRARKGIRLHDQLGEAEQAGAHLVVMDRAAEMMRVLPEYSRSYTLREKAAVALEAAAENAIAENDLEAAISFLTGLNERWPGRDGVNQRIAWCEERLRVDEALDSVLRKATAAGDGDDPEAGLRMLDGANPTGSYVTRFGALRRNLEDQLARMDAAVPTIYLDPEFEAAFKKNQNVVIPLTVTDDLRVERVSAWVGTTESQQYREVVLEPAADGSCPLAITPEMHGNRTIFFYVVAADPAGHQVYFGSPDAPFEVTRKRWIDKVIP